MKKLKLKFAYRINGTLYPAGHELYSDNDTTVWLNGKELPISELGSVLEEVKSEPIIDEQIVEFVPTEEPTGDLLPNGGIVPEPAAEFVPEVIVEEQASPEPAAEFVPEVIVEEPAVEFVPEVIVEEQASPEPAAEFVPDHVYDAAFGTEPEFVADNNVQQEENRVTEEARIISDSTNEQ